MSESDNYLKILEKISEVKEDVGVLKNETQHLKNDMSQCRQEMEHIKEQDIHQNKLLDEHIRGVQAAHKRLDLEIEMRRSEKILIDKQLEQMSQRLEKAETPYKVLHFSRKFLQWAAGVALALIALAEYLRHS